MNRNKFFKALVFSLSFFTLSASAAIVSTGTVSIEDVELLSNGHMLLKSTGAFDNASNSCTSKDQAFVLVTHVAYKQFLAMALTASASGQNVSIVYNTDDGCLLNRAVVTKLKILAS